MNSASDPFRQPVRNQEAMRVGLRGFRHAPMVVPEEVDAENPCDGWRPLAERFDDFDGATFDSWGDGESRPLGATWRSVEGEWDDPTWARVEFDLDEYLRLREVDEANRVATREGVGSKVRSTRGGGFVYYAQGGGGLIKIGCSRDVPKRMRSLRAVLLAAEPGGFPVEAQRHEEFAIDRAHGEWFRPSAALLSHVASLTIAAVAS